MTRIQLAVNGTLMRGFALNRNLVDVGAEFVKETSTAPCYRLWSITDSYPAMLRDDSAGNSIRVEIWTLTPDALIDLLLKEPPGLCIGRVELESGETVFGVLAEPFLIKDSKEISSFGGWQYYMNATHPGESR